MRLAAFPSYIAILHMSPLDFEELLWGGGIGEGWIEKIRSFQAVVTLSVMKGLCKKKEITYMPIYYVMSLNFNSDPSKRNILPELPGLDGNFSSPLWAHEVHLLQLQFYRCVKEVSPRA